MAQVLCPHCGRTVDSTWKDSCDLVSDKITCFHCKQTFTLESLPECFRNVGLAEPNDPFMPLGFI